MQRETCTHLEVLLTHNFAVHQFFKLFHTFFQTKSALIYPTVTETDSVFFLWGHVRKTIWPCNFKKLILLEVNFHKQFSNATSSNLNIFCFCFQNLLNSVNERAPIIEQVNSDGGRFIREGKVKLHPAIIYLIPLFTLAFKLGQVRYVA